MTIPDKDLLLDHLPPYQDQWVVISNDQDVNHIIDEILNAHKEFAPVYDKIALYFDADTVKDICKKIYRFCKENLEYVEETEQLQSTATPAGLLIRGHCDCKGYASFIAGILDGIKRLTGKNINWSYRFASYNAVDKSPHHVFVVVNDGSEIWIDPTPGANKKQPAWITDKKVKTMPLMRNIAGLGIVAAEDYDFAVANGSVLTPDTGGTDPLPNGGSVIPIEQTFIVTEEVESDDNLSASTKEAIDLLYQYGIIDIDGNLNDQQLFSLMNSISPELYQKLSDARYQIEQQVIGGFFSNIFRGVKKVSLAIPRNAYLSLVALNVFGTATKLQQAILHSPEGKEKISNLWYKLGGTPDKLFNAAASGSKKKRIMGVNDPSLARIGVAQVGVAAWVAAATAIIAAITPLLNSILKKQPSDVATIPGYDPSLAYTNGSGGTDIVGWIKSHPIESAAIGLGGFLLIRKMMKKRSVTGNIQPMDLIWWASAAGLAIYYFKQNAA